MGEGEGVRRWKGTCIRFWFPIWADRSHCKW